MPVHASAAVLVLPTLPVHSTLRADVLPTVVYALGHILLLLLLLARARDIGALALVLGGRLGRGPDGADGLGIAARLVAGGVDGLVGGRHLDDAWVDVWFCVVWGCGGLVV